VQKWLVGDVPFYLKFVAKMTYPGKNGDLLSIFACSTSAVTLAKKVQLLLRKSTKSFTMSLR